MRRPLVLVGVVLALACARPHVPVEDDGRVSDGVVPTGYRLRLDVDPALFARSLDLYPTDALRAASTGRSPAAPRSGRTSSASPSPG